MSDETSHLPHASFYAFITLCCKDIRYSTTREMRLLASCAIRPVDYKNPLNFYEYVAWNVDLLYESKDLDLEELFRQIINLCMHVYILSNNKKNMNIIHIYRQYLSTLNIIYYVIFLTLKKYYSRINHINFAFLLKLGWLIIVIID